MKTPFLVIALSLGLLAPPLSVGHGDEDHGEAAAAVPIANGIRPQRLPDGSVYLPKEAQRRWQVRTLIGEPASLPRTVELNAHVVVDTNAGGKVQSLLGGRLEGGPDGLPTLGQKVRKGQVLARVVPAVTALERSAQQAQLADLRAQLPLAQKRLARYRELEGTVPRKELDSVQTELESLTQRISALRRGINTTETLVAPVDGVIAASYVSNGQVVEARDVLFDVVNPERLLVEALVYDPGIVQQLQSATLVGGDTRLTLVGRGSVYRDGALPVLFRASSGDVVLAVGQALNITAQMQQRVSGVPLPMAAIVKNAANETIVWIHETPERFRAVGVKVQPLDGRRVTVLGLKSKQRVVVSGANLLNQIR